MAPVCGSASDRSTFWNFRPCQTEYPVNTSNQEDMSGRLPTDRVPDDELVRRISAGDAEAFTALFRRRHADVFRFAVHMTGSPAAAEDVTQDA